MTALNHLITKDSISDSYESVSDNEMVKAFESANDTYDNINDCYESMTKKNQLVMAMNHSTTEESAG